MSQTHPEKIVAAASREENNHPPKIAEAGESFQRQAHVLDDIFRKEAIDEKRSGLGCPIKPIGITVPVLSGFLVLILICTLIFLALAKYARKETVMGQVTPTDGAFRITATMTGVAAEILVTEGQPVKAGQELGSITSNPVLGNGNTLVESLQLIQATQRRAQEQNAIARLQQIDRQTDEMAARRTGLSLDMARIADAAVLLDKRKRLQQENLAAYRKLAQRGMVSPAAVRQHTDGLLAIQQQTKQAERESGLQRSQLAQLEAQLGRLQAERRMVESDASSYKAQLREREVQFEALHAGKLVSPVSGTVAALLVHAGASVIAGQALAVVIPQSANPRSGPLQVELWAPSRAVGFVRPGAKVRLMYDAFPYQTFGVGHGTVRDVSGTPLSPAELNAPANTEELYRIRVSLDQASLTAYGRVWTLVPGMRLSADLILEEQSLAEWVLGPIRAVKRRAL